MFTPRIRILRTAMGCLLAASLSQMPAGAADKDKEGHKDAKFVEKALHGNAAEVAMGEMAARKAQSQDLKTFAAELQKDHAQANQQLRPIAQRLGIEANPTMNKEHQKELTRLEKLHGHEFDQQFTTHSLRDHVKDIAEYQKARTHVQDAQLRQYIDQTLPTLERHFQHGKEVALKVGVSQSTIASIERGMPKAVGGSESIGESPTQGQDSKGSKGAGAKELKDQEPKEE